ncbi:hypothetical protein HY346_01530 [Candidatus Microgenomates bacterium]|nr:hypothetical protein [Candidatus Microgenomates bacterium]
MAVEVIDLDRTLSGDGSVEHPDHDVQEQATAAIAQCVQSSDQEALRQVVADVTSFPWQDWVSRDVVADVALVAAAKLGDEELAVWLVDRVTPTVAINRLLDLIVRAQTDLPLQKAHQILPQVDPAIRADLANVLEKLAA